MGFNCGIVGLPNVGKSTLFNALTATQAAQAANYPFCTIEPNVGRVAVPDPRLDKLAAIATSAKIINTQLEFVDIAGLVKGASQGEGLGNQFLANIREVDAIAHVLRCFEDGDVTHVSRQRRPGARRRDRRDRIDAGRPRLLEKRLPNLEKRAKGGDKEAAVEAPVVKKALDALRDGKPAREAELTNEEWPVFQRLQLITAKPMMYVLNVEEASAATGNKHSEVAEEYAEKRGMPSVVISAAIEAEVAQLPPEDQADYLASLGLKETGLARVVRAGYKLLDLVTFFTGRPQGGARLDGAPRGQAPEAAGVIHTDFEKGFIRAETIAYDDYVTLNGGSRRPRRRQAAARGQGVRRQGRRRLPLPRSMSERDAGLRPAHHPGCEGFADPLRGVLRFATQDAARVGRGPRPKSLSADAEVQANSASTAHTSTNDRPFQNTSGLRSISGADAERIKLLVGMTQVEDELAELGVALVRDPDAPPCAAWRRSRPGSRSRRRWPGHRACCAAGRASVPSPCARRRAAGRSASRRRSRPARTGRMMACRLRPENTPARCTAQCP